MKAVAVKIENKQYNLCLSSMIDRFVQYLDISPASVRSYMTGIKVFMQYLSENGINTPTKETITQYKKYLSATKSANTTALYLSSIRRFFSWCASENLYSDITLGIKSPKIDKGHKKDAFSASQIKQIITDIDRQSLKGKRDYAIFCLMSATGLRTCEVTRADVADIRTVQGETCLFIQGKGRTSKSDFVKLSEPLLQAIREYLKARGNVADNEPLFASLSRRNFGGRMTTFSVSRICKTAMRHSGFDSRRLTAHLLRHSAVTIALLAGMSLQDVSQFARHGSINVTLIYAHDIERLKSKVENTISNAIFG